MYSHLLPRGGDILETILVSDKLFRNKYSLFKDQCVCARVSVKCLKPVKRNSVISSMKYSAQVWFNYLDNRRGGGRSSQKM